MIDKSKLAKAAMSDEELDNVAGGNSWETAGDSQFLNSLNGSCKCYDKYSVNSMARAKIKDAWAQVGIQADLSRSGSRSANNYYLNGSRISREQAMQHAREFVANQNSQSE